jgi:TM2 domain-containing membrane protein YozV
MKKLFLACALVLGVAGASFASNYKLDEAAIESAFTASEDITMQSNILSESLSNAALADGDITKGGFLVRAYFCGFVGMHRAYVGNGGKKVGLYYCLSSIVGVGYTIAWIDFLMVLIKGDEMMSKFKDNPKFIVWIGE